MLSFNTNLGTLVFDLIHLHCKGWTWTKPSYQSSEAPSYNYRVNVLPNLIIIFSVFRLRWRFCQFIEICWVFEYKSLCLLWWVLHLKNTFYIYFISRAQVCKTKNYKCSNVMCCKFYKTWLSIMYLYSHLR